MNRRRFKVPLLVLSAVAALSLVMHQGVCAAAQGGNGVTQDKVLKKFNRVTPAEQKAAAKRAQELGMLPGVAGIGAAAALPLPGLEGPGGVPHYFGPYGNWAFSPLPTGGVGTLTIIDGGTGYTNPVVTIGDAYGTGSGATATATALNGVIDTVTIVAPGAGYSAPVVSISDMMPGPGAGAAATATPAADTSIASITVDVAGTGYLAPAVTILDPTGTGALATATVDALGAITAITVIAGGTGYTLPSVVIADAPVAGLGSGAIVDAVIGAPFVGGIRKFVDKMPGLTPAGANALGQYIPLAVADTTTYPGSATPPVSPASDYYEIALVEYVEQMHSDLPATRLRGYVQLLTAVTPVPPGTTGVPLFQVDGVTPIYMPDGVTQAVGVDKPHYLGPTIVGWGNKPIRIKFYNLLPAGPADPTGHRPGDLFLPVDESVPGSGLGPAIPGTAGDKYTQNRATVHLHGNNTVWISDGTPHQWITPPNEDTPYPQGVTVQNVPDMDPASVDAANDGTMTFYYTNAMSARLMFYHDHAFGITRLNVYAGEAAGYLLTDQVDQDMINGTNVSGVNPGLLKVLPDVGIPLVIQDRTFVDAETIFAQDPTWNSGTGPRDPVTGNITGAVTGDFWYPHVYMSVQNPWDLAGTNAFGRWHYGPWFNPPVPTCVNGLPVGCIETGPVDNEYYQPICDGLPDPVNTVCTAPWEPPLRPGVPNPSMPGESFLDTPLVNGTAYPYLEVEPKAYRFRILNAGNDRFLNLQLYVAADKTTPSTPGAVGTLLCDPTSLTPSPGPVDNCTEVKMVPVSVAPANQFGDTPSGIPDPATAGPNWVQIGTEGGWLPAPVVVPQQPVGWNLDPAFFNFGVVNQHSLFLGSAERADVIVDFSAYAGKTLILYNDAPAPVPAGASPYDYYTGSPNQMDAGGAPTTQPGYGPNTRTIMQIRVASLPPAAAYDVAALNAVFAKGDTSGCATVPPGPCKRGVFEVTQDPIIIPQAGYNSAYNNTFPATAAAQYIQIGDLVKTFSPIDKDNVSGPVKPPLTMPLEMKAMHDEMGGVYDTLFGRMAGMLGLSNPTSPVHVLIPYPYSGPPTDIHLGSATATQIGVVPDGTQIWRIFHNGVDTHPIHVHLFNAQLVNRLGQDGALLPPDPNELGWKDTFRVNPLEIIYLAMRPVIPTPDLLPFEVPDSVRLLDPSLPEGATLPPPAPAGWFDPAGNPIPEILNHFVNFGWEYVWHCHILSHEEADMMHALIAAVPPVAPSGLTAAVTGNANNPSVVLIWTDNSIKETQYTIQRATDANFTAGLAAFNYNNPAATGQATFTDSTVARDTKYWYRVHALGSTVGDALTPGFQTMTSASTSNTVEIQVGTAPALPAAPTALVATLQAGPQVTLIWRDNATTETFFAVERCAGVGCTNFAQIAVPGPRNNTGNVSYVDTTVAIGTTYLYQVKAVNAGGSSLYSNIATAAVPARPAAPSNLRVSAVKANGPNYTATLTWADNATNETGFTVQRATNATFTTGLATASPVANATTLTQTVTRNTTYYYRIRANNTVSGSSAWVNALPFPIRTGP